MAFKINRTWKSVKKNNKEWVAGRYDREKEQNLNKFTRQVKRHFPGPFFARLQMTALCFLRPLRLAGNQNNTDTQCSIVLGALKCETISPGLQNIPHHTDTQWQ